MFAGLSSFVARAYPRSIRHQHASTVFTFTSFQCASSSRIINCKVFRFLDKPLVASLLTNLPAPIENPCGCIFILCPVAASGSPSFKRQALLRRKHRTYFTQIVFYAIGCVFCWCSAIQASKSSFL